MTPGERGAQVPHDALTVGELLRLDVMAGARFIAGADGLGRLIRRLNVMSVPDILRWTKHDEFLLTTGYPLPRDAAGFGGLVEQLAARGLAGMGVKLDEYLSEVPAAVIEAADRAGFPIAVIPHAAPFDDILSQAFEVIVNRQAAALAKTQEIHDAFIGATLTGGGLAQLADGLSVILPGAQVAICDTAGRVLAATSELDRLDQLGFRQRNGLLDTARLIGGVHEDDESGARWAVGVIRAGTMRHGFVLAVRGQQGLPDVAGPAVQQAALVAALEITRHLAVLAAEQQFASNALHDLVTSTPANVGDAVARAASFRWDLQRPLAVLVARPGAGVPGAGTAPGVAAQQQRESSVARSVELWTSAVRACDPHAAVAGFATELVAIVGATQDDPVVLAQKVQVAIGDATRQIYSVGVSQVSARSADIPRLYEEARVALQVGHRLSGNGAVTGFGGLGLYRLISSVSRPELQAFVHDTLGPLLGLPEPARGDMLKTLAVYFDTRFNIAESARRLHFHYNTMRYRVSKLERMLGEFGGDAQAGLRIGVCLQILRMYEISGDAANLLT
jgi:PucR family transcriptional regulator, purine catabolism regulatory protein